MIGNIPMVKSAFITPKEFADFRGVHRSTVIRWIKMGHLPAEQPAGKKGRYDIPQEALLLTFPAQTDLTKKS